MTRGEHRSIQRDVVPRKYLRTIWRKNLRHLKDLDWRREWESANSVREIRDNWPQFAHRSGKQGFAAFQLFRLFSTVHSCFRILPARCHSKCHLTGPRRTKCHSNVLCLVVEGWSVDQPCHRCSHWRHAGVLVAMDFDCGVQSGLSRQMWVPEILACSFRKF